MRFNFYKKLFILLFKTKLIFKRPNKKKILFFDASHSKLIIDKFKMNYKNYEILNSRFETLNIPILIQTIKKEPFNLSLKNYFLQYISAVKPEKVITLIDNNITFYQFKKYFPDIEFFSIQCGHRTKNRDFFLQLKKKDFKKQDLSCDRVFVANLGFGKKMQKYINCKITPLGFFKNNFIKISNNKIQKKTILFISQFREYQINADSFKKKHFFVEKKILPVIQKYCKDKNFLFYILGCSKNSKLEEKYFQSILKPSNFIFKKKLEYPKNYKFIDKFEVVTFIDSTLGYEAISRKKKVAVFSKRKLSKKSPIEKFGWPVRYPNKGLFYSNRSFNLEDTYRILNNVTKISQKNWNKKILPSMKELAIFNYKNSILKIKLTKKTFNKNDILL